jgi:hypothetical protein
LTARRLRRPLITSAFADGPSPAAIRLNVVASNAAKGRPDEVAHEFN